MLEGILDKEKYEKVRPFMITTFERGMLEGKREGMLEGKREGMLEGKRQGMLEGKRQGMLEGKRQGMLEILLAQLEAKFGPLSPDIVQRVWASSTEQLSRLTRDILKADSLRDLRLHD